MQQFTAIYSIISKHLYPEEPLLKDVEHFIVNKKLFLKYMYIDVRMPTPKTVSTV